MLLICDIYVAMAISSSFVLFMPLKYECLSLNMLEIANKGKYVHQVLVNRLFKLAQEKVWLGELTVHSVSARVRFLRF